MRFLPCRWEFTRLDTTHAGTRCLRDKGDSACTTEQLRCAVQVSLYSRHVLINKIQGIQYDVHGPCSIDLPRPNERPQGQHRMPGDNYVHRMVPSWGTSHLNTSHSTSGTSHGVSQAAPSSVQGYVGCVYENDCTGSPSPERSARAANPRDTSASTDMS